MQEIKKMHEYSLNLEYKNILHIMCSLFVSKLNHMHSQLKVDSQTFFIYFHKTLKSFLVRSQALQFLKKN